MNSFINALQTNDSLTQNEGVAHSSSGEPCLDFFFAAGSGRSSDAESLYLLFKRAFLDNPLAAMRTLFWVRDVRGGAGERKVFRNILVKAASDRETSKPLELNVLMIPEYGRWDDLFELFNTPLKERALDVIKQGLVEHRNGLCAKWMPRRGVNKALIRDFLGLSDKEYRNLVVSLSKTVEQQMSAKNWGEIVYPHVPSVAMKRYTKAFNRNDAVRFNEYKAALVRGEAKINASAIFPHDVLKNSDSKIADAQWEALPDYMPEGFSVIPVVDVSGSMFSKVDGWTTALEVAVALGLYVADKNKGDFKDFLLTFSDKPSWVNLSGVSGIAKKSDTLRRGDWGMNTNLEALFKVILKKAVAAKVPQSDLPTTLLILSDMQFDHCVIGRGMTVYARARQSFERAGYKLPNVVFWNIVGAETSSFNGKTFPVKYDTCGTALVSGYSPSLLKSILSGDIDPMSAFKSTVVNNPRYEMIAV